jgi:DNA polymerase III epsilon subunit-like protein
MKDLIPIDEEITGIAKGIFFLDKEDNIYGFAVEMCRYAGYSDPSGKAYKEISKAKEFYDKYSCIANLAMHTNQPKAKLLMNDALHVFMMGLDKPKAMLLKQGYARIVEKFRRGSLVEVEPMTEIQILKKQTDMLVAHDERIGNIETKLLPEKLIEEEHAAEIFDKIVMIAKLSGQPRSYIWWIFKREMKCASYLRLPLIKLPLAREWLDTKLIKYNQPKFNNQQLLPKFLEPNGHILVIDIETTGLNPAHHRIIEVAAVLLDFSTYDYKVIFESLVNPNLYTKEDVTKALKYHLDQGKFTVEEIHFADYSSRVIPRFRKAVGKLPWTAFNSEFEAKFLTQGIWNLHGPSGCLMHAATEPCGIPDEYGGCKWPKLVEAYEILLDTKIDSNFLHRAKADAILATEVLIALHKKGHYSL